MSCDNPLGRLSSACAVVPVAVTLAVDVTDGDNLYPTVLQKVFHIVGALVSRADTAHDDPVTRGDVSRSTQRRRRDNIRQCQARRAHRYYLLEQSPTCDCLIHLRPH